MVESFSKLKQAKITLHNRNDKTELKLDKAAIEGLKNGDAKVFECIFRFHFQPLWEFACYYLQDREIAENIVQDVFLYLWQHKKKLKIDMDLKAYLYAAVKNKSLNQKRHRKVVKELAKLHVWLPDSIEMPDVRVHRMEIEKAVEKAIQELPAKRRMVFCMHRFEKLTYKEIAKIQGISTKTVETQMKRALLFLEKRLSHFLSCFLL